MPNTSAQCLLQLVDEVLEILEFGLDKVLALLGNLLGSRLRGMVHLENFGDVRRTTSVPCQDLESKSAFRYSL